MKSQQEQNYVANKTKKMKLHKIQLRKKKVQFLLLIPPPVDMNVWCTGEGYILFVREREKEKERERERKEGVKLKQREKKMRNVDFLFI